MFHVILFEPEIPPNTGNIIRLCANAGAALHLVEPLGFSLEDTQLKRAGLDYRDLAQVRRHRDLDACRQALDGLRVFPVETQGGSCYAEQRFQDGDAFLFGRETSGLPTEVLAQFPAAHVIRLPMLPGNRSINLSNAAAIVLFEAWRQLGFPGGT
jgi:tRNA (cytidine/uridine-2'-O-)-methyltransferase